MLTLKESMFVVLMGIAFISALFMLAVCVRDVIKGKATPDQWFVMVLIVTGVALLGLSLLVQQVSRFFM